MTFVTTDENTDRFPRLLRREPHVVDSLGLVLGPLCFGQGDSVSHYILSELESLLDGVGDGRWGGMEGVKEMVAMGNSGQKIGSGEVCLCLCVWK